MVLLIQQTILVAIPLMLVALGGVFAERSGIVNLGLEGEMIFGAFAGAVFVIIMQKANALADSPQLMFILALAVAAISGAIFSLLLSFSAIKLKADQTIGGTALNMLAPAIVCAMGLVLFNQEKIVPLKSTNFAILTNVEGFFAIFANKIYISTYVGIVVFVLLSIWLYKSKTGMHLRACGEHPQAADSVGINVFKMRYLGTTISGALAGLGGYTYIATLSAGTAESSVAGMGFLALAIMIFGNWKPLTIALGALMFGFLKNLGVLADSFAFLAKTGLPMYFYNLLPYFAVLVVLIITRNKSGCPKAEGIPYDKSQR